MIFHCVNSHNLYHFSLLKISSFQDYLMLFTSANNGKLHHCVFCFPPPLELKTAWDIGTEKHLLNIQTGAQLLSHVNFSTTPWTVAHHLGSCFCPVGFSRQEYSSGLPFPSQQTGGVRIFSKILSYIYIFYIYSYSTILHEENEQPFHLVCFQQSVA